MKDQIKVAPRENRPYLTSASLLDKGGFLLYRNCKSANGNRKRRQWFFLFFTFHISIKHRGGSTTMNRPGTSSLSPAVPVSGTGWSARPGESPTNLHFVLVGHEDAIEPLQMIGVSAVSAQGGILRDLTSPPKAFHNLEDSLELPNILLLLGLGQLSKGPDSPAISRENHALHLTVGAKPFILVTPSLPFLRTVPYLRTQAIRDRLQYVIVLADDDDNTARLEALGTFPALTRDGIKFVGNVKDQAYSARAAEFAISVGRSAYSARQ
ncbi:MAG: hypothetical protein AAB790_01580 [Patescibacteria group bacterium]